MPLTVLTALLTIAASVIAAALAERMTERIAVLGTFAGLRLSHNPGIAFGVRIPSPWQEIIIIAALVIVCVTLWKSHHSRLSHIAFGLIIGGAVANLVDRFADGFVTDFFQVGAFPIFNMADSAITIGAVLLILESLLHSHVIKERR